MWGSQNRILAHIKCSKAESGNDALWDGWKQSSLNLCRSQNRENPAIKSGGASSSLLGRARSLVPAQAALRGPGDTTFQGTFVAGMLASAEAPDRHAWCPWKAPGTQWAESTLAKSSCLSAPHFRTGARHHGPPRGQPQVPWLPKGPRLREPGIYQV